MASSCEKLDQLVKDYLLFRGFTGTCKMLDQEMKTDKDKGLRVDRMMDYIWTHLAAYDLTGLREYWRYLNQRIFSRLDQRYTSSVRKLESGLLKLYVVNAHQCGKHEKVRSFFEVMGPELQTHSDFKDWFAFPFVSNPAENPVFSLYFNKQWQDTLQLSLHNFLSVVLQAMPVPTLLNVEFDARRMKNLQEENTHLKEKLRNNSSSSQPVKEFRSNSRRSIHAEFNPPTSPPDMVYDFSGLAEDVEPSAQEKQKPTRRFPLSLTSPLGGRKKSESSQIKPKVSSFQVPTSSTPIVTASSSTNTVSKGKHAELSSFPPPSGKIPSNGKKSLMIGGATTSPPQNLAKPQSSNTASSRGSSPSASRKMSSASPIPSLPPEPTTEPTLSQSCSTNRSFSIPGDKVIKTSSKSFISKQVSEEMTDFSSSVATRPQPMTSSAMPENPKKQGGYSVSEDIGNVESPFYMLEDEYTEHNSAVSYCRFGPTGQYVASLDIAGIVKVWMWSPQPSTSATIMSKSAFLSLAWLNKTERFLLLGNKSGSIRLFDVKENKTHKELQMHPDNSECYLRVNDICMNPSSNYFVCATSNLCPFTSNLNLVSGKLLQWDMRTWKVEKTLQVNSKFCDAITCSSFSQRGHLLTGGADGYMRLYDGNQCKPVMEWRAHDSPIHTMQFQGKDSVYSMDTQGKLCEWTLSQPGQIVNSLYVGENHIQKISSGRCRHQLFSFDRDGQYLLTYKGHRGVIYQVQGKSGPTCVTELKSHLQPVVTVDWSPSLDTQVCLTGSIDGKVKISTLLSK